MTAKYNQTIYFICRGTNCNDIISSIPQKSSSIFSFFENNNSIKEEKTPHITDIGIAQLKACYGNVNVKKMFDTIQEEYDLSHGMVPTPQPCIYSSLESSSIDSAMVLISTTHPNMLITPMPFMANSNIKSFDILKTRYPKQNSSVKYWQNKIKSTNYNYLKSTNSSINWDTLKFILDNTKNINKSSLYSGNLLKFLNIYNTDIFQLDIDTLSSRIFICDGSFIQNILRRNKKFSDKFDIIEYGSVWKISTGVTMDTVTNTIKDRVFYEYEKIYPTEYNYLPLTITKTGSNNKYTVNYDGKNMKLFDSMKSISIRELKKMIGTSTSTSLCINGDKMKNKINKTENIKTNNTKTKKKNKNKGNNTNNANNNKKKNTGSIGSIKNLLKI